MTKMDWDRIGQEARDSRATEQGHPKRHPGQMTKAQERKFKRKLTVNAAKAKLRQQKSK